MRKHSCVELSIIIVIVAMLGFSAVCSVYAAEAQPESENKIVRFFKNVFNWPFGVTKKSAETVGRTTEKAVTTVTTTGSSVVETVTGKPEKIKDVVVEPVKGSGETVYTAVEGTLKVPIEATEEAFNPQAE